ncbi:MAG: hypothetical protein LBE31_12240, partial [Deltaproteobacteria bacterium]|nr:hypothetical protein [Deltaproteobacteria bacterium]
LSGRLILTRSRQIYTHSQTVDHLDRRLKLAFTITLSRARSRLTEAIRVLGLKSPHRELARRREENTRLRQSLITTMARFLAIQETKVSTLAKRLGSVSPLRVLTRGYAVVTDCKGKVIKSASQVAVSDQVTIRLAEGNLSANITKTEG